MTSRRLNQLSCYWKKKLGQQDWSIIISFVDIQDMHQSDNVGECLVQLCDKSGVIKILRDNASDHEIEWRIIHEYLHVVFCDLVPRDKIKAQLFEAGIDRTARTLIGFKYGKKI